MLRDCDSLPTRVSQVISQFFKSRFDLEPTETLVVVQNEIVMVRIKGIISKAEVELAKTKKGLRLVDEMYRELFEKSEPLLESMLKSLTGMEIKNIQTNINYQSSECVHIIEFTEDIEQRLRKDPEEARKLSNGKGGDGI